MNTQTNWTRPTVEIQQVEQWLEGSSLPNEISCAPGSHIIVWLREGSAFFDNGIVPIALHGNLVICLLYRNQKITLEPSAKGFVISFSESLLKTGEQEFDLTCQSHLFKRISKTGGLPVSYRLRTDLSEVVNRMMVENINSWVFKTEMLKRYLKIFLVHMIREFENGLHLVTQTKQTEHVDKFIGMLEQNFRIKKMVSDYADKLFVTPNYLNEIVKHTTGYPASYHIRKRIISEAKHLAIYTDSNMKEIAYNLGFSDCSHFSKFFKVATGGSFSEYKKQLLTVKFAV